MLVVPHDDPLQAVAYGREHERSERHQHLLEWRQACAQLGRGRGGSNANAHEGAAAKADSERLDWLAAKHYMVDFINEDVEPTLRGEWICTNGDNSHTSVSLRAAIDAARKHNTP